MTQLNSYKLSGHIKTLPYQTYHVSEIDKALMVFGKSTHVGKIVITYTHDSQLGVKVMSCLACAQDLLLTFSEKYRFVAVLLPPHSTQKQHTS